MKIQIKTENTVLFLVLYGEKPSLYTLKKEEESFHSEIARKVHKKCDNFDTYVLWTAEAQLFFLTLCFYQRKTMIGVCSA